jgi:hypothetical protein
MVVDHDDDDSLRGALVAKLDDMTLYDEAGDPRDEGYMDAVRELREWLSGRPARPSAG